MKKIEATIPPFKREDVKVALAGLGVEGLTVSELEGFWLQKMQTEIYRGSGHGVGCSPQMKIEVVLDEAQISSTVDPSVKSARTRESAPEQSSSVLSRMPSGFGSTRAASAQFN